MRDHIVIGSSPAEEDCVQLGEPDYEVRARAECERFIQLIRAKLGAEPEGAKLVITENKHEFGVYLEVACQYDEGSPEAVAYALRCEAKGPKTWED